MNGRELAGKIVELLPEVRVLYMSGYTENAIGHDGLIDAGINLLQKPFSLPALKDRVREVLDSEPSPSKSPCHLEALLVKERFHPSALVGSICICRCATVRWEKRAGARAQPKTSAVPDCCSRRRRRSIRACNSRSAWCCRRKLPVWRPPKSCVAGGGTFGCNRGTG